MSNTYLEGWHVKVWCQSFGINAVSGNLWKMSCKCLAHAPQHSFSNLLFILFGHVALLRYIKFGKNTGEGGAQTHDP